MNSLRIPNNIGPVLVFLDNYISRFIDEWHSHEYDIFIGSDHGMNSDGQHGGSSEELSSTPFYHLPWDGKGKGWSGKNFFATGNCPNNIVINGFAHPGNHAYFTY